MKEQEWVTSVRPYVMLYYLSCRRKRASDRKLRLFYCACCRSLESFPYYECIRDAVNVGEKFADLLTTKTERAKTERELIALERDISGESSYTKNLPQITLIRSGKATVCKPLKTYEIAVHYPNIYSAFKNNEKSIVLEIFHAKILRDIIGNPFRPVTIDPTWRTSTVVSLAQGVYEERELPSGALDTTRLAILADALQDAGCENADILKHCRQHGEHVRGCWVIDKLLGKE